MQDPDELKRKLESMEKSSAEVSHSRSEPVASTKLEQSSTSSADRGGSRVLTNILLSAILLTQGLIFWKLSFLFPTYGDIRATRDIADHDVRRSEILDLRERSLLVWVVDGSIDVDNEIDARITNEPLEVDVQ